jgi:hypothetical protein
MVVGDDRGTGPGGLPLHVGRGAVPAENSHLLNTHRYQLTRCATRYSAARRVLVNNRRQQVWLFVPARHPLQWGRGRDAPARTQCTQ